MQDSSAASSEPVIGIVGAGKLGRTLARLSVAAGLHVLLAGSGPVTRTARVLETFAPGAVAAPLEDVVRCDIVVLAIPLSDAEELDPSALIGAVVVDPMNHWDEADGPRDDFQDTARPTSVAVQEWFAESRVVKALNHVAYKDLAGGARERGNPRRIGIAIAGSDASARERVAAWIDRIGFDPVWGGSLADTYSWQPGGPIFGSAVPAAQLRAALASHGEGSKP